MQALIILQPFVKIIYYFSLIQVVRMRIVLLSGTSAAIIVVLIKTLALSNNYFLPQQKNSREKNSQY
jgi:hypothetical protein